jgi:hypothetical protein
MDPSTFGQGLLIRTVGNARANETPTIMKNQLNVVEKFAVTYRQYCAEYGLTPAARIRIFARPAS